MTLHKLKIHFYNVFSFNGEKYKLCKSFQKGIKCSKRQLNWDLKWSKWKINITGRLGQMAGMGQMAGSKNFWKSSIVTTKIDVFHSFFCEYNNNKPYFMIKKNLYEKNKMVVFYGAKMAFLGWFVKFWLNFEDLKYWIFFLIILLQDTFLQAQIIVCISYQVNLSQMGLKVAKLVN